MSSGLKSSSKLRIDLLRTPPGSVSKQEYLQDYPLPPQDYSLRPQNKSGVKSAQRQEPTRSAQIPIQPFFDTPPRAESQAFNFITLGRFQTGSTITRIRICKWVVLLTIKILSILTATVFWLAAPIYLKTLLNWKAPGNIFYELTLRYLSGSPSTTSIWKHIFPGTDCSNSHHLRLAVHSSSYLHSPIIYSTSIPLLLDNPMVWLFVMVSMFNSHHLLCFAHDCLSRVSPTIR